MRLRHLLLGLGTSVVVTVAGCQLVTGVDTIDYGANPGGGGGQGGDRSSKMSADASQTGVNGTSATVTSTSSVPDVAASSTGTGPGCGDGDCGAGETACNCLKDCSDSPKFGNGCCENGEATITEDCGPTVRCNHDSICEPDESCDHCDDCGCQTPSSCDPARVCFDDCMHNADCANETTSSANSSGSVNMFTPMCCKCNKGPLVCMGYYACQTMGQFQCMTVP